MLKTGLAFVAAFAAAVTAGPAAERLNTPKIEGFVLGYEATQDGATLREMVPQGETVEDWSRMVTDFHIAGGAETIDLDNYLDRFFRGLARICPDPKIGPVMTYPLDGMQIAKLRFICDRLPKTGKPEVFYSIFIVGRKDFLNRQVAFRHLPSPAEVKWAESIIASTKVCAADAKRC